MIKDKSIFIQNIYYMLSYAFMDLKQNSYERIDKEEFDNIFELLSEILYRGVSFQLKQGLYRQYINKEEDIPTLRGKLHINRTILNRLNSKQLLCCTYSDLSENNIFNKILKTTLWILIKSVDNVISFERKKKLKDIFPFFKEADIIDVNIINWKNLIYFRNNQSYLMLMHICYFILDSVILTTKKGDYKLATFSEEHMEWLFEHFVLNFYKTHYAHKLTANSKIIDWNINKAFFFEGVNSLPRMKSDVLLTDHDRTLIIDTKYYSKTMQEHYNKKTIISGNLYQIFTYVKNYDVEKTSKVSGLLLYAKTDEDKLPKMSAIFENNRISVETLDLNQSFEDIKKQLDDILKKYFYGDIYHMISLT